MSLIFPTQQPEHSVQQLFHEGVSAANSEHAWLPSEHNLHQGRTDQQNKADLVDPAQNGYQRKCPEKVKVGGVILTRLFKEFWLTYPWIELSNEFGLTYPRRVDWPIHRLPIDLHRIHGLPIYLSKELAYNNKVASTICPIILRHGKRPLLFTHFIRLGWS